MLELKKIVKIYPAGDGQVEALKGVDLQFRKSEFVSILGPSGCGKTTLLNIIGGLDHYTSGDLFINGKSTKDFKDRDWDAYRNHSVGFVFQSYNLIPHQSVLQNVELALTLSGVSKSERKKRAAEALEKVGLKDQLRKKPSELSGGQMQRVAIARAIVNDPDIILADEPTGALDTETSVQVLDILKEISKDRLVIMVTHNPELADAYSTRIIRMIDGIIKDDSAPLTEDEKSANVKVEPAKKEKVKKPSMSLVTSFGLSLKNLFTKKGRTSLVSFAGSIGIIGIALIFAVSQGMTTYIDTVQEETLSSYPLTLQSEHEDLSSLLESFIKSAQSATVHEKDAVYQKTALYDLVNALSSTETKENDLKAFKAYLEKELYGEGGSSELRDAVSGVRYTYDTDFIVYTKNVEGNIIASDTQELISDMLVQFMGTLSGNSMEESASTDNSMMGMMFEGGGGMGFNLWTEMLPGLDGSLVSPLIENQYDVIYGSWPNSYDEIVVVVDENNEIDDMGLYALGLTPKSEIEAIVDAAATKKPLKTESKSWSFEEILATEYRTVFPSNCYELDEKTGLYHDLRETELGLGMLYDRATKLRVVGIIRPKEDALSPMITGSIGYTSKLTEYIIENSKDSKAIKAQLADPTTDIFTGLPFKDTEGDLSVSYKAGEFKNYINSLDSNSKAATYVKIMCMPTEEQLSAMLEEVLARTDRASMEKLLVQGLSQQTGMLETELSAYVSEMSDDDLKGLFSQLMTEQLKLQYAAEVQAQLAVMTVDQLSAGLDALMATLSDEQLAYYYDGVLTFAPGSYEDNLRELGYVDLNDPLTINLYASSFEEKDTIEAVIASYNDSVEELERISYTDYVGLMMSSVTTIINAITYVLIAFVAVSLVVSSIMIGVITLISVQERTKEIGILRAIGASKRNVSSMFTAETVMIGFCAGLLGVLITYLLCIPINMILHLLTGIGNLSAYLPLNAAITLVIISMVLTLFAGIIPSRSAAKKDPVVALRTE